MAPTLRMTEQAGSGDPVYILSRLCASATEVAESARANLAVLLRGTRTLAATISRGSPAVAAETELRLRGFRQGEDDRWGLHPCKTCPNRSRRLHDTGAERSRSCPVKCRQDSFESENQNRMLEKRTSTCGERN